VADRPVHPVAVAMQWVARIFAAAIMMVVPGVVGEWGDSRWSVGWLGPAGFVLGLMGGMAYLIAATRSAEAERKAARRRDGT
jgi:hypothetical protein